MKERGKCNPIRCSQVISPEDVNRKVFCRYYDDCLDYAIRKQWGGFSCEKCDTEEKEELEIRIFTEE